jgi:phage-related protein
MSYQVVLFQTSRGDRVVAEYISNLPHPTYSKYLRLIGLLAEYGPHLSMPYSRKLTKELYELRTKGKNPIRVIYTEINHVYILLHAFQKKTQKTPTKEIATAKNRRLTLI